MNRTIEALVRRNRRSRRRGMTLIEIIVVIAIIGVLTATVAVAVIPALENAKRDRARIDISNIESALKIHYAKKGKYPDTSTGLKALIDSQALDKMPKDPWDKEYLYLLENGKPVIMTYTKDGVAGGTDNDADISSKDVAPPK